MPMGKLNSRRELPSASNAGGIIGEMTSGESHTSKCPSSPVRNIDPWVRALNTLMYGLLVHFGTLWTIDMPNGIEAIKPSEETVSLSTFPRYLMMILFLHEYWVYLQHCNVLGNPLCQRLDRQYGIALLKSNEHWAIAGTLSAYWCRETLGMFLCLPFLGSLELVGASRKITLTHYLILYSLIYHTIKSRGVRKDALQRYSPTFGIMRVVIDKFYLHTTTEAILSFIRLFLQGLDTFIHFCIVRDMASSFAVASTTSASAQILCRSMNMLFGIWVIHAALNQLFRCSTASVMVQCWHSLTNMLPEKDVTKTLEKANYSCQDSDTVHGNDDDSTQAESISSQGSLSDSSSTFESPDSYANGSFSEEDKDFIVRKLLDAGRVPDQLKGRQGAATKGVDKAVRIETVAAILASFYLVGMGEVPFRILTFSDEGERTMSCIKTSGSNENTPSCTSSDSLKDITMMHYKERITLVLPYAWLLWSLLYGIWVMFLRTRRPRATVRAHNDPSNNFFRKIDRQRAIFNALDMAVMIASASSYFPSKAKWQVLIVAALLTWKSFLQAAPLRRPRLVWNALAGTEFAAKMAMMRFVLGSSSIGTNSQDFIVVSSAISIFWSFWVISNPIPTPCELASKTRNYCSAEKGSKCVGIPSPSKQGVADVVFLGHPAELSDCWALWLLPYSLDERWEPPFWALPLWPLHYLVGLYVCKYRQKLFGDGASFFCCDDVNYEETRMQTWTAAHFGRHFVTHPRYVKQNIEAAARHAEKVGVKVLCLGALNKAESINGGGRGVAQALGPNRRLSLIHGNHLTAAAVVETTHQCFGAQKVKLFLTGASSKVGWAVAQALRDRYGYEILCHSTDQGRRAFFEEHGFASASTLAEGMSFSEFWIVGKYDTAVTKWIPQNATAIVFSVPHPLESRPDVRVVEAGTLHIDTARLNRQRRFTNKLREQEIFACHAASLVAAQRLAQDGVERIDETGPVDPRLMDGWLEDAKKLGIQIPSVEPVAVVDAATMTTSSDRAPVVVVGAGPAGLAVAADLSRHAIPTVILEAQEDAEAFGSWDQHFSGLEVTSQKKWCNLPGFAMGTREFPGETVTADEYRRYLGLYSRRFSLDIRRGAVVESVAKGKDELSPWMVKYRTRKDGVDETTSLSAWAVVVATGKHRVPRKTTSDSLVEALNKAGIPHVHSTELRDDASWSRAIQAAERGRLCLVGFGNSAADLATAILQQCSSEDGPKIHIAARTVPPVFPRRRSFLRVDTLGYLVSLLPAPVQDSAVRLLWACIPSSRACDAAFPAHLNRWNRIAGRVPVIDKYGIIAGGFVSGRLVGHGPIATVNTAEKALCFRDTPSSGKPTTVILSGPGDQLYGHSVEMDLVVLATGYQRDDRLAGREDRLNGLFRCGFGADKFLPLRSIGEEAKGISSEIVNGYPFLKSNKW